MTSLTPFIACTGLNPVIWYSEELQEALDMLEKEETPQVTKVRADCRSIFGLIVMEWRGD